MKLIGHKVNSFTLSSHLGDVGTKDPGVGNA